MELVRDALGNDEIPIVIGQISDSNSEKVVKTWTYGKRAQREQEQFVKFDKNAALVNSTHKYGYSDRFHYYNHGYIKLGEAFAEAILRLMQDNE